MGWCSSRALLTAVALLLAVAGCEVHAQFQQEHAVIRQYNTTAQRKEGVLNVHLVAHTHDDVGWLKTVDQYFYGARNDIQTASVQYILDTVLQALEEDSNRRFIYVEQAFFQRWWRRQSDSRRDRMRRLVANGQLEFINGGWCMHDEAATYYTAMIDQTALGHRYIKQQFNVTPTIGWQIDPFGHSATQATLLTAEVGFDATFFARIDYEDRALRHINKGMEMIWRPSQSLGKTAQTFAGAFYQHYDPPWGLNWEIWSTDAPVMDDPILQDYNVGERVERFVQAARQFATAYQGSDVMFTMGSDFHYSNADQWFQNLDKIMHYVNQDGRVHALYSTPSKYLAARHADSDASWPLKTDDFFPYADCPHCYWTGYFTSRPALKAYASGGSSFLQAARQLEWAVGRRKDANTDALEEAVSVAQHHDGVSGTSKQHVANDYAQRISVGMDEATNVAVKAIEQLASPSATEMLRLPSEPMPEASSGRLLLSQCPLANISVCPPSEQLTVNETLTVMAYNPLAWAREVVVRLPVSTSYISVTGDNGEPITAQILPISDATKAVRARQQQYSGVPEGARSQSMYELVFLLDTPPVGYAAATLWVREAPSPHTAVPSSVTPLSSVNSINGIAEVGTALLTLGYDQVTGQLKFMRSADNAEAVAITQTFQWYSSSKGDEPEDHGQAGGAYIFRPSSNDALPVSDDKVITTIVFGPVLTEVRQEFASWATLATRIYAMHTDAELEWTVGPVPFEDNIGKEVILRIDTGIPSGGVFWTDSNGREWVRRVVNGRGTWPLTVTEQVAGNYYPVNAAASLASNHTRLTVLTDRSQGAASLKDGSLEFLVHRRLFFDDWRGVAEPLNETECGCTNCNCPGLTVRGTMRLVVGAEGPPLVEWARTTQQLLLEPAQLFLSEGKTPSIKPLSLLAKPLPESLHLLTLHALEDNTTILRIAHLYEAHEHPEHSKPVKVDILQLFGSKAIRSAVELSLSGNQPKGAVKPMNWRINGEDGSEPVPLREAPIEHVENPSALVVTIAPMEIRTFGIIFGK
eukprot:jgi/Chlat1/6925/Chrsp52S06594